MSEYVNGVDQFGNIIVDSDRVSSDSPDVPSGGGAGIVFNATYNPQFQELTIGTTFGAIRTAFESGIPVFIKYVDLDTTKIKAVQEVSYAFYSDSAQGSIVLDMNTNAGAWLTEAPFTLEALDAQPV